MTWRIPALLVVLGTATSGAAQPAAWSNYGGDPSHTALSSFASPQFGGIRWQTTVDQQPVYTGTSLLIHYGSPVITAGNTVVVPVKTGTDDGFQLEGRSGATGALLWTQPTDYTLPVHNWVPSYSPTIAPNNRLYYAGAGGTIYTRANLDAPGAVTPTQLAFYGIGNYNGNPAAYNNNVNINTPITSDTAGNIYFGYQVTDPAQVNGLQSGFARISSTGQASFVTAASLAPAGDNSISKVTHNCAPALSPDGSKVYFTVTTANGTGSGNGYLVGLNTSNLAVAGRVNLLDIVSGNRAQMSESGTASPMVGPNGDVYIGVLESPFATAKGWMLHYDASLTQTKPAGAFGWDNTPSVVPRALVPSYHGTSDYLLMTKYNNYAGLGGDGVNKIAILDPNDTQIDARTGATVMKEILTIAGVTHDPEFPSLPNAVREWCINTAVVDPFTHSVLVNSEDGNIYRWDLFTNTFTQVVALTSGVGEAYTPTLIGPDGTTYAINNAMLFAIGVPEPTSLALVGLGMGALAWRRRRDSKNCEIGSHARSESFAA